MTPDGLPVNDDLLCRVEAAVREGLFRSGTPDAHAGQGLGFWTGRVATTALSYVRFSA